jgi:phenylacetic acid degradation protein
MAKVYSMDGIIPVIAPSAFVHPDAVLIGDVIIGPGCYIGPCACLRGDYGRIRIEAGVNIQDTCVIHTFPQVDVIIEEDGHIGHGAIIHGCIVKKNAMVGMNSVIMDNSTIGESSLVAACSFVKAGMNVPPFTLVAGIPAKVIRKLSAEEAEWKSKATGLYQQLAVRSLAMMKPEEPLPHEEQNRRRVSMSNADLVSLDIRKLGKKGTG